MLLQMEAGVAPGSVKLSWTDNGAKAAQDDGMGNITGAWTGTVDYRSGDITLTNFAGGDKHLDVKVDYSVGEPQTQEFKAPARGHDGNVTLNLAQRQIKPRSFEMTFNVLIEDYDHKVQEGEAYTRQVDPYVTVRDNGSGGLVDGTGTNFGNIDYATGTVKFKPDYVTRIPKPIYRKQPMGERIVSTQSNQQTVKPLYRLVFAGFEYINALASAPIDDSFVVTVRYRGQQSEDARTKQATSGVLRVDLLPTLHERVVPGSVCFTSGSETYFDRRGELYYRLNPATGAATKAGSINYETGIAVVELAEGSAVRPLALAGTVKGNPVDEAVWRIPSAPVRPASLHITATPLTGGQLSVRADAGGKIEGSNIEGSIDYETGVVRVRFGRLVTAAGNEGKYWYNPDAVENGKIWEPIPTS